MKKKRVKALTMIALTMFALITTAYAGQRGPTGPQGVMGIPGTIGPAGENGRNGEDATKRTAWVGGADVRVADGEHIALHFFDDYNLREGRNGAAGVRLEFKIGRSWEEKQIALLGLAYAAGLNLMAEELAKRDAKIGQLDAEIGELKFQAERNPLKGGRR